MGINKKSGKYLSVVGVLLAGVVLSVWLFNISRQWEIKGNKEEFQRLAADRVHLFKERVNDHIETIYSIASFFAHSNVIERNEFKIFVNNIFKFRDTLTFVFWIQKVDGRDRKAFEQSLNKEGFSDFEIRSLDAEGRIARSPDKPFYYPIKYIESSNIDPAYLVGLDLLSEPARAAALENARDSGSPAITARIIPIGILAKNYSCVIFYPVYRQGAIVNTVAQRRDNLLGFISLTFEIKKTLENSRKGLVPVGIDMAISDESAPANEQFLYYYKPPLSYLTNSAKGAKFAKLIKSFTLYDNFEIAGRRWLIKAQAEPEFFANLNFWQSWIILLIGLLLTVFLAIFLLNLLQSSEKVKLQVLQRTEQLAAANKALENEIAAHKKVDESLLESREELVADKVKMENMVVSMAEGVIMLDESNKIVILNPQARWMLGFNEEVDSNVFLNKLKAIKLYGAYQECMASRRFIGKEAINYQGHFLLCEMNPVKNAAKTVIGTVIILRDITKEKEIDAMKSEFVSTVSHELRTPLSITKEGISLVLDGITGEINEKQRKILLTSRDNMDRLARIINNLLDISKIESGKIELKREPIDMNALVSRVARSFESRIKSKGLDLKLDIADKSVMVYADSDKLIQVLTNLIGNACKFTQKGRIEVFCHDKDDKAECSVMDTGVGISPDDLSRVFEKFQQFTRIPGAGEKGTGLGLSIVKALVELHNGKIWAESTIGKGSKFSFSLPKYSTVNEEKLIKKAKA